MYQCNLQISVFSYQSVIGEVIRKIPQLEYVSHCVIKRARPTDAGGKPGSSLGFRAGTFPLKTAHTLQKKPC